jgi:hypothetical protein
MLYFIRNYIIIGGRKRMYYVGYPQNKKTGKILPNLKVIKSFSDYDKAKEFFNSRKEDQPGMGWLIYQK